MTALRLQIGLLSFAVLASAVLVNIFYLQPTSAGRTANIQQATSQQPPPISREHQGVQSVSHAAASSDTLRAIQRELQARGYTTGPTGSGLTTVLQAAVMAYEYDQGLPLTGEIDENTMRTIILGPASLDATARATAKPGPMAQQVIAATQQLLIKLGYGPLQTDGAMSDAVVAVIRRFEREQGMTETGRISGDLIARLTQAAALGPLPNKR